MTTSAPSTGIASQPSSIHQAPVPLPVTVDTTGAKIIEDDASSPDQRDSRDIYLPNHVESVSHIAVDVGGSLAKVVYFTRARSSSDTSKNPTSVLPTAETSTSTIPSDSQSSRDELLLGGHINDTSPDPESRRGSSFSNRSGALSSSDSSFNHPAPSGTLTPTAILSSRNHSRQPSANVASAFNAVRSSLLRRRSLPPRLPGGRLNFIKFETGDIESCISFLKELIESSARANNVSIEEMRKGVKLMATGGGAHMFYDVFEQELGVEVHREDEMGCLITGLNFITLIPDEVFSYSDELVAALHNPVPRRAQEPLDASPLASSSKLEVPASSEPTQLPPDSLPRPSPNPPLYAPVFDSNPTPKLPCLLVNIGSGVSMIKVDDYGKYERVSGTSLGGGTLWGLLSLLTDADSFDEMLELSEMGDNSTVDMLVSDIYGNSQVLNAFGLKSTTIASSFGKVFRKNSGGRGGSGKDARKKRFRPEDICKSLLYAVSNNIGQIAYMTAEKYQLDRIYFGGCFIRGHKATISTLSYAIRFWSKGTKRAFFLRHEGYLGAMGAWIKHLSDEESSPTRAPAETKSTDPLSRSQDLGLSLSERLEGHAAATAHEADERATARSREPSVLTPIDESRTPRGSTAISGDSLTRAGATSVAMSTASSSEGDEYVEPTDLESQRRRRQSRDEGKDLLSMLSGLREDHRSIIEPLVAQSASSNWPPPSDPNVASIASQRRGSAASAVVRSAMGMEQSNQVPVIAEYSSMTGCTSLPREDIEPRPPINPLIPEGEARTGSDDSLLFKPDEKDLAQPGMQARSPLSNVAAFEPLPQPNGDHADLPEEEEGEAEETAALETLDPSDSKQIRDLLSQLDAAEGAADGLENRLDDLLSRLDGMLENGGGGGGGGQAQ